MEGQTFKEYAKQKEMFNRWCTSQEVGSNFEKLKQLALMEKFKQCVPVDIKTYLEEQKLLDVYKAATLADNYKLTHNTSGAHKDSKPKVPSKGPFSSEGDNSDCVPRVQDQVHDDKGERLEINLLLLVSLVSSVLSAGYWRKNIRLRLPKQTLML